LSFGVICAGNSRPHRKAGVFSLAPSPDLPKPPQLPRSPAAAGLPAAFRAFQARAGASWPGPTGGLPSFSAGDVMTTAPLDPKALSIADAARILSRASGRSVTEEMLREAVHAGLPLKANERIDIFVLVAWLCREIANAQPTAERKN